MTTPSIFSNFFTIIFPCLILLSTAPSSHSQNGSDFEALLAIKKSIHDDPRGALRSWNETTDFCTWNGVSCSKRHPDRVVALSLRSQGLVGLLSPHVGNLSFLRIIDLQNNTFRGQIPQEIGRLRRLRHIELSNNSFVGRIPTNLSRCVDLYYLNLIDNQLTGGIFPEIGSLANLQRLGLAMNMLSGTIPPSLGNLTNLIQLSLVNCSLQGEIPESLGQLRRMQRLMLRDNTLTGSIPFSLNNLSSLEILELQNNRLNRTLPSLTLPYLRELRLNSNRLTGPLPASLSNSTLIERLQVSDNSFTENMIDFTKFPSLERLILSSNQIEGDIGTTISSLTNCTRLRILLLAFNRFTGSLPDSIGNLSTRLEGLYIGQNQLSGSIPSSIGNLAALTILAGADSNLQGPIPTSIGKLDKLQEIFLEQNNLTNEIPQSLGNLTLLDNLILWQNNLSGNIPHSLGNCTNLLALYLSRNNLNGSIPPEIMMLSSIAIGMDLSFNFLTGTIPSQVGALRNIGVINLSHNRLSGNIPTSLSSCVLLVRLRLGSNTLQGEIPDSLRALRGLEYLDLSQNNFSGTIPGFLSEFRLLYLNLSFNAFQGEVPTMGVFENESAISLQGNHDLCGGIPFLNLPSCSSPNPNKKLDVAKVLIPTAAGAVCLVLFACFCVIMYRRRALQEAGTVDAIFEAPEFLRLSYADLLKATGGFLESNLLGAGRFGSVYRGAIISDDGNETLLAVKVLNLNIRGAYKSLASECNALRGIRHRNLLKIMNVCDSIDFQGNDFKALVYEFMANGSLESWLHHGFEEQGRRTSLSTLQRLDIAIDIASAVEYLHSGTDSIVIHGDLKPSNILLDQDMVAHVGDFGLAKIISSISQDLPLPERSSSSLIRGTIGYIPPEYGMNDVVSTQGDVYSYGILMLEMFTNKRPTSDDEFEGHVNLQDFVSNALPHRVVEVVDSLLLQELNEGGEYEDCIASILRIGVGCSRELPRDRMTMEQAVKELKRTRDVMLYSCGKNATNEYR